MAIHSLVLNAVGGFHHFDAALQKYRLQQPGREGNAMSEKGPPPIWS